MRQDGQGRPEIKLDKDVRDVQTQSQRVLMSLVQTGLETLVTHSIWTQVAVEVAL